MSDRFDPIAAEREARGAALAELIIERFALRTRARTVIAVGGESGSGKSGTAEALARALDAAGLPATVLHQDDYYHRPPRANHEHRSADLHRVGPQEIDFARIASQIRDFRAARNGVTAPIVDYPNDRFLSRELDFAPLVVLVVEGTYVLSLDDADVRVFHEASYTDTAQRRRERNRDIDEPIIDQILAIEHALVAMHAARANLIIDRDFAIRIAAP